MKAKAIVALLSAAWQALYGFQALTGSVEWISRQNTSNAGGLGSDSVEEFQSALLARARAKGTWEGVTFATGGQAYGTVQGYDAHQLHVDEAWGSIDIAGRFAVLGGIQRYPHQYSYYWNPTFPVKPKTDLFRPDYLAAGVPMAVVSAKFGGLVPKFIMARDSGETWYGVQTDYYFRGVEAYINLFLSRHGERTAGAGLRFSVAGWTLHAEGAAVARTPRYGPRPVTWRAASGVNRTLLKKGLLTLEWFHDGAGLRAREFDLVGQAAEAPADAVPGALRRNYSFAAYHYTYSRRWSWGVRNVVCWDDGSGYLHPTLSWTPGEHVTFGADLLVNYSRGKSDFGLFPVRSSVSLRLGYYL